MKSFFSLPDTEELVRLYADDVLRVCNYYLGRRNMAEDAFQDVFVKVIRKRDSFDGKCPPKYWLLTIAKNVCKDHLKSSWSTRVGSYDCYNEDGEVIDCSVAEKSRGFIPVNETEEEDRILDSLEPEGDLWSAIMSLPDPIKEVVLYRFYYQLDNAAIAKACNITESTVRSRLFRARKKLASFRGDMPADGEKGGLYEESV